MSYNCPEKANQQTPQKQNSNQKLPYYGKVIHVSKETAMTEPEVMLGTFDVHSIPVTVFFILELRIHSYLNYLLRRIASLYVP
jgi:hypothetical protein